MRAEKEKSDGAEGSRGGESGISVEKVDMDVCSVWCWLERYECAERKKKHGKFLLQRKKV